jgi:hypothetical protein
LPRPVSEGQFRAPQDVVVVALIALKQVITYHYHKYTPGWLILPIYKYLGKKILKNLAETPKKKYQLLQWKCRKRPPAFNAGQW